MDHISKTLAVFAYMWLIVAAAARIAIQITQHTPLDALPFISATIGLTGLSVMFLNTRERAAGAIRQ